MNFFSGIVNTVTKVVTGVYGIIKIALPILKSMRPASNEVDEAFKYVEQKIASGGIAADDFLDRNLETIQAINTAAGHGIAYLRQLHIVTDKLIRYSQLETPDTLTPAEVEDLGREIVKFRELSAVQGEIVERAIALSEAALRDEPASLDEDAD